MIGKNGNLIHEEKLALSFQHRSLIVDLELSYDLQGSR